MKMDLLVIGYGNEMRNDDGVGPRVARAVAEWRLPNVEAFAVHQLTPELADQLGNARRVVFVDAGLDAEVATIRPIDQGPITPGWGHACDPGELLALTSVLHGCVPEAWLITVQVANLGFGERLSETAERGLKTALQQIRHLVQAEGQPCTKSD